MRVMDGKERHGRVPSNSLEQPGASGSEGDGLRGVVELARMSSHMAYTAAGQRARTERGARGRGLPNGLQSAHLHHSLSF